MNSLKPEGHQNVMISMQMNCEMSQFVDSKHCLRRNIRKRLRESIFTSAIAQLTPEMTKNYQDKEWKKLRIKMA